MVVTVGSACKIVEPEPIGTDSGASESSTSSMTSVTGSAATDDSGAGSSTAATSGAVDWPIVMCGSATCETGELCWMKIPGCAEVMMEVCGDDTTGTTDGAPDKDTCMLELPRVLTCLPVPAECHGTAEEVAACLEADYELCPYGAVFTAGKLDCEYNHLDHCETVNYLICPFCP